MSAVWMRVRAELRARWRAWAALSLLLGVFAGSIIAAAAAARRTDSAYPRFRASVDAADVFVPSWPFGDVFASFEYADVAALPGVERSLPLAYFFAQMDGEDLSLAASRDPRYGYDTNRLVAVEGRLPLLDRSDEVTIPYAARAQYDLDVGDVATIQAFSVGQEPLEIEVRVVGVHAAAGELPPVADDSYNFFASPAFHERYAARFGIPVVAVWLEPGVEAASAFNDGLARAGRGKVVFTIREAEQAINTQRSIHLQAVALWLVALVGGAAVLLVLGQAIARQSFLEAGDDPTLRALGMQGSDLVRVALARGAVVAALACVIAAVVAVGLSPLAPRGVALVAEPDPGLAFDTTAIGAGLAAVVVVVVAIMGMAGRWRRDRRDALVDRARPTLAARSASLDLPPAIVNGVRFALEPGRGRTAVPVRTTIVSAALGVAALVATLTFGRSLDHFLASPELFGFTWDVSLGVQDGDAFFPDATSLGRDVASREGVSDVGLGSRGIPMKVDDILLPAVAFDHLKGTVAPPLLEGRVPRAPDEVMVGTVTLHDLGKELGDTVELSVEGTVPIEMTIVGRGVIPPSGQQARFGEGVFFVYSAMDRIAKANPVLTEFIPPPDEVALRFDERFDRAAVEAAIRRDHADELAEDYGVVDAADVVSFGRVRSMPLILAGMLAVLALGILLHSLVTAIARRGRELAIMKTLGFVRRQVRAAVVWQGITLGIVILAIGIPVGVVVGRWVWLTFASRSGIVGRPAIPWTVALVVPAVILAAVVVALVPARAAGRTRPALVLRAE